MQCQVIVAALSSSWVARPKVLRRAWRTLCRRNHALQEYLQGVPPEPFTPPLQTPHAKIGPLHPTSRPPLRNQPASRAGVPAAPLATSPSPLDSAGTAHLAPR